MPIYEYECMNCCSRFELRRHFGEDGGTPCPQCYGEARRVFSPVPIIFKGSGFYITDNRKNCNHSSNNSKADKDEAGEKTKNN